MKNSFVVINHMFPKMKLVARVLKQTNEHTMSCDKTLSTSNLSGKANPNHDCTKQSEACHDTGTYHRLGRVNVMLLILWYGSYFLDGISCVV